MISGKMSDSAILKELGQRLRRERLNRNLTQADLAEKSGIGRRTLIKAEAGEVTTLATLVAILRGLELIGQLDQLVPEPSLSPVQLAQLQGRARQRASKPRGQKTTESPKKTRRKWQWKN